MTKREPMTDEPIIDKLERLERERTPGEWAYTEEWNDCPNWFRSDRQRHSQKPDCFYDLVESSSPGPYMEMFSRKRRFGWAAWGNEV